MASLTLTAAAAAAAGAAAASRFCLPTPVQRQPREPKSSSDGNLQRLTAEVTRLQACLEEARAVPTPVAEACAGSRCQVEETPPQWEPLSPCDAMSDSFSRSGCDDADRSSVGAHCAEQLDSHQSPLSPASPASPASSGSPSHPPSVDITTSILAAAEEDANRARAESVELRVCLAEAEAGSEAESAKLRASKAETSNLRARLAETESLLAEADARAKSLDRAFREEHCVLQNRLGMEETKRRTAEAQAATLTTQLETSRQTAARDLVDRQLADKCMKSEQKDRIRQELRFDEMQDRLAKKEKECEQQQREINTERQRVADKNKAMKSKLEQSLQQQERSERERTSEDLVSNTSFRSYPSSPCWTWRTDLAGSSGPSRLSGQREQTDPVPINHLSTVSARLAEYQQQVASREVSCPLPQTRPLPSCESELKPNTASWRNSNDPPSPVPAAKADSPLNFAKADAVLDAALAMGLMSDSVLDSALASGLQNFSRGENVVLAEEEEMEAAVWLPTSRPVPRLDLASHGGGGAEESGGPDRGALVGKPLDDSMDDDMDDIGDEDEGDRHLPVSKVSKNVDAMVNRVDNPVIQVPSQAPRAQPLEVPDASIMAARESSDTKAHVHAAEAVPHGDFAAGPFLRECSKQLVTADSDSQSLVSSGVALASVPLHSNDAQTDSPSSQGTLPPGESLVSPCVQQRLPRSSLLEDMPEESFEQLSSRDHSRVSAGSAAVILQSVPASPILMPSVPAVVQAAAPLSLVSRMTAPMSPIGSARVSMAREGSGQLRVMTPGTAVRNTLSPRDSGASRGVLPDLPPLPSHHVQSSGLSPAPSPGGLSAHRPLLGARPFNAAATPSRPSIGSIGTPKKEFSRIVPPLALGLLTKSPSQEVAEEPSAASLRAALSAAFKASVVAGVRSPHGVASVVTPDMRRREISPTSSQSTALRMPTSSASKGFSSSGHADNFSFMPAKSTEAPRCETRDKARPQDGFFRESSAPVIGSQVPQQAATRELTAPAVASPPSSQNPAAQRTAFFQTSSWPSPAFPGVKSHAAAPKHKAGAGANAAATSNVGALSRYVNAAAAGVHRPH